MHDELHTPAELNPQVTADIDEAAADTATAPAESEEVMALPTLLAQCQQELAEAKNANLRAQADFDNYRKRLRAERDLEYTRGRDRVLLELLPVIDDFERALSAVPDARENCPPDALRQGVELLFRQLCNLLGRYSITPMRTEGQRFDPKYHDAVARIPTPGHPEHTIVGEVQRGYLKNGEVFRPAKVAVAVAPDEPIAEE